MRNRRRHLAELKLEATRANLLRVDDILREVERARDPGKIGAILRREGLYSSHLTQWRRDRDRVAKAALSARKRGPKAKTEDPKIRQLEREVSKLKRRNQRLEALVEIQKKACELLGIPLSPLDSDESD